LALILYKHVIASAGKAVSNGGEVGNGYFLVVDVTDGDKNPNLLQVVNENIRITDKISTPTITKQVYESDFVLTAGGEEGDGYNDVATYKINDDVDYNLNITVPGQLHNYNHYEMVIHDVMDAGLDFKSDSVEVYINKTVTEKVPDDSNGAEEGATKEVTKTVSTKLAADSYVLGTSGDHRFKITFDDIRSLKDENDGAIDAADDYTTFTVKFKATLNQNATTGPANPNDNKVWLCYTNDPNATHDDSSTTYPGTPEDEDNPKDYPDSPDEEDKDNKNEDGTEKDDKDKNPESDDDLSHTPVDVVGVYTYGLTLIKVDGQSKTTKLAGATFTMSQGATEATATAMKFTKVTKTLVEATETEAAKTEDVYYYNPNGDVAELVTDANGQIKVIGLESGESGKYFLTETAAPAGYHKLDGAIELNLDTNVGQEFNSYENDNKDTDGGDVVEYVELKQGTKTVGEKNTTDGIMSITVDNTKGSPLPETGGMGTAIFYTVGGVLVIAAGIYLVMKKRNANA
jgi:fimbrial isopeptide formation D2 family protein/LPXTG-motif cell wall-anchored protein